MFLSHPFNMCVMQCLTDKFEKNRIIRVANKSPQKQNNILEKKKNHMLKDNDSCGGSWEGPCKQILCYRADTSKVSVQCGSACVSQELTAGWRISHMFHMCKDVLQCVCGYGASSCNVCWMPFHTHHKHLVSRQCGSCDGISNAPY
jgi:hypothetical protein